MTTRNFTRAVTSAARAGSRPTTEEFGRLRHGDEFKVTGKRGTFRFLNATKGDATGEVAWVTAVELGEGRKLRSFHPSAVKMPSQRALNAQRRRRAAEQTEEP
jgi:hypothetical protein